MLLTLAFGNQQSVSWEISLTGGVHSRKVRGASRYTRENSGAQGTLEKSQGSLRYTREKLRAPRTLEKSQGGLPVHSKKVRDACQYNQVKSGALGAPNPLETGETGTIT